MEDSPAVAAEEGDFRDANYSNSFPEEKSLAEKASVRHETEVNSVSCLVLYWDLCYNI